MARQYAKILMTIWNDPDFKATSWRAQWLYFTMLSYPTLNSCGVMEWREKKLTAMCAGMSIEQLRESAWELGQKTLIAVDPDTEEALVRSFVRHDGGLKSPNMVKAMVREHGAIGSVKIMELVSREVRRGVEENPNGVIVELAKPVAKQFPEPIRKGFKMVPEWFHIGSDFDPQKNLEPFPNGSDLVPLSLNPKPLSKDKRGAADETTPTETARKRATRIPEDFTITDQMKQWAKKRTPNVNLDLATERFVNYWRSESGVKASKLDWIATWRNWMLTDQERSQPATSGAASGAGDPYAWMGDGS